MANDKEDFFDTFKCNSLAKVKKFSFKRSEKNSSKQSVSETVSHFFGNGESKETRKDSIEDRLNDIFNEPFSINNTTKPGNTSHSVTNCSDKSAQATSNNVSPKFIFKNSQNKPKVRYGDSESNIPITKNTNVSSFSSKLHFANKSDVTVQTKKLPSSPKLNFKNVHRNSSDEFEMSTQKTPTQKIMKSQVPKSSSKFHFRKKTTTDVVADAFQRMFGNKIENDEFQQTSLPCSKNNRKIIENEPENLKSSTETVNVLNAIDDKYNTVCTNLSDDSTVIQQKKFNFKKPSATFDSPLHGSPSLLLDNNMNKLKRDSIISVNSTENSPVPVHKDILSSHVNDSLKKNCNENMQSSRQPLTQPLVGFEDDYLDDEAFEMMFGEEFEIPNGENGDIHRDDQSNNNFTLNESISKASTSRINTEQYLDEVSMINWDENVFEDATTPKNSFKGREDHSSEFKKNYHFSEVMKEVLHQKFGLQTFRPQQCEIINATLNRHDCFVLMPTGGGKSLCYQLPAVLSEGVSVVISPLRALISDQVDKMIGLDIPAAHLCQDVGQDETSRILAKLYCREPQIKLLYLTPEKIMASKVVSDMLHTLYQRGKLSRIVIDEAHCLSQWGHDFRPDYKQLSFLKKQFENVPIMCLTATATKQVENDVITILKLKNVKRFIMSFNRPNIKYQVIPKKGKFANEEIINLIKAKFFKKSGIIYCLARNDCESLADTLNNSGIKTRPYHAGMPDKIREAVQREWMQDRFFIIVATIAFGMGIDKPDVRFVIHNSIPKSVESFYQESGRAGRDGDISYSYLFYNYSDVLRLQKIMQLEKKSNASVREGHHNNLKQMVSFAENVVDCRRYLQLIHLGENFNRALCIANKATTCDNCENINTYNNIEVTKEAKQLGLLVQELTRSDNVTMLHVADVYKGAKIKKILQMGHDKHRFYGLGSSLDKTDIHRILKDLVLSNILGDHVICAGQFPVVYIKTGNKFNALNAPSFKLTIPVNRKSIKKIFTTSEKDIDDNIDEDTPGPSKPLPVTVNSPKSGVYAKLNQTKISVLKVQCHEALLEECRTMALARNLTLSSIMNLTAIKSMADVLPKTKEEFLKIQHVTAANFKKCGENFLAITCKFREQIDALKVAPKLTGSTFSDSEDWTSSQSSSYRGTKRKWTGNSRKKTKRFRRKTPKTPSKKKWTGNKKTWSGKGSKGGGKGGKSGGIGLMPVHFK